MSASFSFSDGVRGMISVCKDRKEHNGFGWGIPGPSRFNFFVAAMVILPYFHPTFILRSLSPFPPPSPLSTLRAWVHSSLHFPRVEEVSFL